MEAAHREAVALTRLIEDFHLEKIYAARTYTAPAYSSARAITTTSTATVSRF